VLVEILVSVHGEDETMKDEDWEGDVPDEQWEPDGDENPEGEEDFASLLEQSLKPLKQFSRGEKVRGRVIGANAEWIFLDLGAKGEGAIPVAELASAPQPRTANPGDWLEAFYLGEEEGEIRLTTRIAGAEASRTMLEDAYHAKIPVEGMVAKEIKGGFEVQVGAARCFCPYSQMDVARQDAASYVGQTLSFVIAEFKEGGRSIVLSRRQLLEAERRKRLAELQARLQVGERVEGTVRALEAFGAFIDLGGIDGLIPMAELSWGRVRDAAELLTVGQALETQVVDLDWERKRITLSLKRLSANPWTRIHELLHEEQVVTGRVVSLAQYGAFVEVLPGIDGLIHVSRLRLGKRVGHPREVLQEGEMVQVRVESIDDEHQRLALSLETAAETTEAPGVVAPTAGPAAVGHTVLATVEAVKLFGVLARLPDGRVGLVPVAELLTPEKAVLRRHYQVGQQMTVQVLEITEGGKRLRLSERAAQEAGDASRTAEYLTRSEATQHTGLGTLADLLKKGGGSPKGNKPTRR
jgi:small subunit ribosomal protein S1